MYAPIDEDFKTWTDASGNAFPTATSITFTGLDQGVSYKVKVRARYNGSSGDWSGQVETLVMAEQQAAEPPSNTPIPPTNTSVPPTNTPIPPTNTSVPPSNTPIPPTNTPVPPTNTPIPPTNTPVPPTNTPVPPTNTPIPPTNTPIPPTNTPVPPTNTQVPEGDRKSISGLRAASDQAGVIALSWDAPSETPRDYRVNWGPVGQGFPSFRGDVGNAYPTSNSYTISGVDEGARFKVRVRARYDSGGPGDWSGVVEVDVAGS